MQNRKNKKKRAKGAGSKRTPTVRDVGRMWLAEEKAELTEEIPLGRMGSPEEVAETAFFLAGDGAGYITGQVIPVNGGWRI